MDNYTKKRTRNVEHNLYHHGLVKLLIMEEIEKKQSNWGHFLVRSRFLDDGVEGS